MRCARPSSPASRSGSAQIIFRSRARHLLFCSLAKTCWFTAYLRLASPKTACSYRFSRSWTRATRLNLQSSLSTPGPTALRLQTASR